MQPAFYNGSMRFGGAMDRMAKTLVGCLAIVFATLLLGYAPDALACHHGLHAKHDTTVTPSAPKPEAVASVEAAPPVHSTSQHAVHKHGDRLERAPVKQFEFSGQHRRRHSGAHDCAKFDGACCFGCTDVQALVGVQGREPRAILSIGVNVTNTTDALAVNDSTRPFRRPERLQSHRKLGSWRLASWRTVLLRASSRLRI